MKELNWNSFEYKFNGTQENAFERLSYALFCSLFNKPNGISALKNHPGLETNPIKIGNKYFGFQAKYSSPSVALSSKKNEMISSLRIAKENEPKIDVVYIFLNKAPSSPSKKTVKYPQYISDIEEEAKKLKMKIEWQFPSNLTAQLSISKNFQILKEFFPELIAMDSSKQDEISLENYRTAVIQVEILKIKHAYSNDWVKNEKLLNKLNMFVEFKNEIIADDIFDFIRHNVSVNTRSGIPSNLASIINSIVLTYFPSSIGIDSIEKRIENGLTCINIGYDLTYDAFIHINDFGVAQWGLRILKFIYREGKRQGHNELTKKVLEVYEELEITLNRPQRKDLEHAKEMVQIFKNDLDNYGLWFPDLPIHLHNLTMH